MLDIIKNKLKEIESKENVTILHCVESGSRAWGFASPDSDYDVRFVYLRKVDDYLRLEKTRDVIEWQLDDTLDISGWDLQKYLRLLHSSNPTTFEWNASPIVYYTTDKWQRVSAIVNDYFMPKSGLYHYLSMAKGNFSEYLKGENVRLKKYFYVIRPILACKWIIDNETPPPVLFSKLMESCLDDAIKPYVDDLLQLKTATPEIGMGKRIDPLNEYLESTIAQIEDIVKTYPSDTKDNWDKLNLVFCSALR